MGNADVQNDPKPTEPVVPVEPEAAAVSDAEALGYTDKGDGVAAKATSPEELAARSNQS